MYTVNPENCGCLILGGWKRVDLLPNDIKEAEKEIKVILTQAEAGWYKMIIATVLKEQEPIRKLLRKYGFKKTPEAKSKYRASNTQCIYYWDSNCIKKKDIK